MSPETRDTVLRMLLPAILVGAGYIALFSRSGELATAQEKLEAARAAAVDDFTVAQARRESTKLTDEKAALQKDKDAIEARWTQLTTFSSGSAAQRAAALRQLTRMLWDRGLYPFEESPAAGSGQLPASFDEVLKRLATAGSSSQPRLWQVRFYGRYADVVDALTSLGDTDLALVPVGLTMTEANPETSWRVWTLLLWN
jgi:hypothetical protein